MKYDWSIRLYAMLYSNTRPYLCLSSGIWLIPWEFLYLMLFLVQSSPLTSICPSSKCFKPVNAYTSSLCPFPSIPAIHTISFFLTLNDILFERRVELFAENSMAFDYWRNKLSVNNSSIGVVNYNDYRAVFPIPQEEIDMAPDILIQNPEY